MLCVSQVQVSATGRSLVQRNPTDCVVTLCVIQKPQEWGGPDPRWAVASAWRRKPVWVIYLRGPRQVSKGPQENDEKLVEHSNFRGGHRNFAARIKYSKLKPKVPLCPAHSAAQKSSCYVFKPKRGSRTRQMLLKSDRHVGGCLCRCVTIRLLRIIGICILKYNTTMYKYKNNINNVQIKKL